MRPGYFFIAVIVAFCSTRFAPNPSYQEQKQSATNEATEGERVQPTSKDVGDDVSVAIADMGSGKFRVAIFNQSAKAIKLANTNCRLGFDQFQIEFETSDDQVIVFRRKPFYTSKPQTFREIQSGSFFSEDIELFDGFWLLDGATTWRRVGKPHIGAAPSSRNDELRDLVPSDLATGKIRVKFLPTRSAFAKSQVKNGIYHNDLVSEWMSLPHPSDNVIDLSPSSPEENAKEGIGTGAKKEN